MGLGSMRAAVEKKELDHTYSVINNFRIPVKLANIGAPQLIPQEKMALGQNDIDYLMELIDAKLVPPSPPTSMAFTPQSTKSSISALENPAPVSLAIIG